MAAMIKSTGSASNNARTLTKLNWLVKKDSSRVGVFVHLPMKSRQSQNAHRPARESRNSRNQTEKNDNVIAHATILIRSWNEAMSESAAGAYSLGPVFFAWSAHLFFAASDIFFRATAESRRRPRPFPCAEPSWLPSEMPGRICFSSEMASDIFFCSDSSSRIAVSIPDCGGIVIPLRFIYYLNIARHIPVTEAAAMNWKEI
jgi:hypothetical protein